MSDASKTAIDKLTTLKEVTQNAETKQIASIMITYIQSKEKQPEAGFVPPKKEEK